jgi:uncharacterized membrane protein YeaQ/YmgE (transglycosylase-associated protein family)
MPTPTPTPAPGAPDDDVARVGAVAEVRHAPRYRAFALAGALLGAVLGVVGTFVVAAVTGRDANLGYAALFTGLGAALLGAIAGAVVAVLLDRRS